MREGEEVHAFKHLSFMLSILQELLLHLEHFISFYKGILFQLLVLLFMLELLEHSLLLSLYLS